MRGNITIVLIAVYNRTHWAVLRCPGANAPCTLHPAPCTLHRAPPAARKAVAGRLAAPTVQQACGGLRQVRLTPSTAPWWGLFWLLEHGQARQAKKVQRVRCVAVGLGVLFLYNRMI